MERAGISVYSYMGRLLASPRWGARPETLGRAAVSLGPDTLAAVDQADRKGTVSQDKKKVPLKSKIWIYCCSDTRL